jgi:hypothetical protein
MDTQRHWVLGFYVNLRSLVPTAARLSCECDIRWTANESSGSK